MLITVGITTVVWLAATFLTAPEPMRSCSRSIGVCGPRCWVGDPVARLAPDVPPARDLGWNLLDWLCGCVLIYGALFRHRQDILKETGTGILFLTVALCAGLVIYWDFSRRGWKTVVE